MVTLLILTSDSKFATRLQDLLADYSSAQYQLIFKSDLEDALPKSDIVLIDEEILGRNPTRLLAQYIFELSPSKVIYLAKDLSSPAEYEAVKGLAADYLYKDQLTSSSLNNCIKYVLEASRLRLEIEKQQKRYESLFYNAVDPAFFLTPNWEIENVNQAFSELFRIPLHKIQGMKFSKIFRNPEDFEFLEDGFINQGKNVIDIETAFHRIDQKGRFPGHLKLSSLREFTDDTETGEKKITGFHGTLSNVSDRKRLQKIQESSDQLAMTYRLARTLAHEIRNPLTNITLSLNQLEEEVPATDDVTMYFNIIERCAKRIDKLIDQLLRSSQRQYIESSECDLIDVVKDAIEGAKDRAKLREIVLITDFESNTIPYFCDTEKIKLAVSNLITNAIESIGSPSGQVIIGTYEEGNYFQIYVEDNGAGMSEEQKESLFDPFFTSKKNGLGLGLTSTQGIILEHKGQIEVESEVGVGSTFTILLPKSVLKSKESLNN